MDIIVSLPRNPAFDIHSRHCYNCPTISFVPPPLKGQLSAIVVGPPRNHPQSYTVLSLYQTFSNQAYISVTILHLCHCQNYNQSLHYNQTLHYNQSLHYNQTLHYNHTLHYNQTLYHNQTTIHPPAKTHTITLLLNNLNKLKTLFLPAYFYISFYTPTSNPTIM